MFGFVISAFRCYIGIRRALVKRAAGVSPGRSSMPYASGWRDFSDASDVITVAIEDFFAAL